MRTDDSKGDLAMGSFLVMAKKGSHCGMCHFKARLVRIVSIVL